MQAIINFLTHQSPLFYWTQSLWRDEAFSVWIAKDTFLDVIARTSGDFNPPFYYFLLHVWMKLFGPGEIALRGLSVLFFILLIFATYIFAKKIFGRQKPALLTTLLMATNPMLIYFAFELRMYSLLALLSLVSMYFLYAKKWKLYIITATLGLYTQPFMAFVIIAQNVYLLLNKKFRQLVINNLVIAVLFAPWLPTLLNQFSHSGPMWMFPVDSQLITAVLGNLYFGYEGTPGNLWTMMKFVSFIILIIGLAGWQMKKLRPTLILLYLWIVLPLGLVLGISLFKPIYVHRYLIFVAVGEVFLLCYVLYQIRSKFTEYIFYLFIVITFLTNFSFVPAFHHKVPISDTFQIINPLLTENDVVYAATPLIYFETLYYTPPDHQVKLYNPEHIAPPRFVGAVGMPESTWAAEFPHFPKRAFMIAEDGTYIIVSKM